MKRMLLSFSVCCLLTIPLLGQDKAPVFGGIETGFITFDNEMRNLSFIRESASDYDYYGDYAGSTNALYNVFYAGFKQEFPVISKLSFSTGIRFTQAGSNVKPETGSYMYLFLSSDGTTTNFAKARKIAQNSQYLGIPLEFRWYLPGYHFVRSYVKLGATLNYRIATSTKVTFTDDIMNQYNSDIVNQVRKPDSFYSMGYAAVGLRFGKQYGPSVNLEAVVPSFVFTTNSSSLTNPLSGFGVQVTLQFPMNFKSE